MTPYKYKCVKLMGSGRPCPQWATTEDHEGRPVCQLHSPEVLERRAEHGREMQRQIKIKKMLAASYGRSGGRAKAKKMAGGVV